ncbi:MAG: hypothetical protein LC102_03450 [Ignavibacteriales bacterium]|nr:MAG: hypothetical protein F9K26_07235 [Ignavibacteriaceae bacterium]MBW7872902.1 hypothetical protein [Ignavibacteria bacterium]MCZ2142469.1 hypothetical protein [Ignavibacteriales bacterium]OQY76285.1 MAG: hypothetical protein B6D45_04075 [Ignavibacteriales bacterium UTCHB3]MBV6445351.1 hypothetical protein [Ignavibacteriaceae bacterium]
MLRISLKIILFSLILVITTQAQATKFGFGCLGLVGGFAGYEVKNYDASVLNQYVSAFNDIRKDSLLSSMNDFGSLKGFRLGMNLVRNRISGLEYTLKVFYETLNEVKEAQIKGQSGIYTNSLELKQNVFGAGLELGTPLSSIISWKILEVEFSYGTAQFFRKSEDINNPATRVKYTVDNYSAGFNLASGFIFFLIDNNISLEGKMGYSQFSIGKMHDEDGNILTIAENSSVVPDKIVSKGGLFYGVQFNLSIPL